MSATNLIMVVIFVSLLCIIVLWLFQIKRQRTIERARKTVIYTSQIVQIHQVVDSVAQFLDDSLLNFLAKCIDDSANQLTKHKIQLDKRCQNTQEQALLWINEPKKIRKQARSRKSEGQKKRLLQMKSIIQHIRQAISRQSIPRKEALSLANSTKISKIKLACHYFQQEADDAIKNLDTQEAIFILKKTKTLLMKIDPIPSDVEHTLISCSELLTQQQEIMKQSKPQSTPRLEEELDKQEEIDKQEEMDQGWQKKQDYDS
jgi:hypothetical protein